MEFADQSRQNRCVGLSAGIILGVMLFSFSVNAQQDGNIGVGQQQQQGQAQGQSQSQGQRQGQSQTAISGAASLAVSANSNSNVNRNSNANFNAGNRQNNRQSNSQSSSLSNTNKFESRPGAPSIGGGGFGFGGAGSYGDRNACVMHRPQAWSVGGGVGVDSSGVTGGTGLLGRGTTEMVLIVYCELGESARELHALGLHAAAHKLSCMHPYKRQALEAVNPGMCDGVQVAMQAFVREDTEPNPPVTMVDATLPRKTASATAVQKASVSVAPRPDCKHGVNEWGRCLNPDFDSL